MIECVEEKIYYGKKDGKKLSKRKRGRFLKTIVLLLAIFGAFYYYREVIAKNVIELCADKCAAINAKCVNNAIVVSLNDRIRYEELVTVDKNGEGKINMLSANAFKMNAVSREIVDSSRIILEENLKNGIEVPLFAFSGLTLLSGFGPDTRFSALSVSAVNCDFKSSFSSVGINQTLHSVYAEITSEIRIDFPLNAKSEIFSTKILLCEAVLVGEVPEIYLNGGLFNKS